MDSEPTKAEKICNLAALLKRKEPLAWETVEDAVADYPGWASFIENLHYPQHRTYPWRTSTNNFDFQNEVPRADCETLFIIFEPYAILLDTQLDNSQKFERIEASMDYSDDHTGFWDAALDNLDPEIRTAATELLAWKESQELLLRGSEAPETDAEELLRAAKSTESSAANLLRSGEIPAAVPPKSAGFWARLLRRR